MLPIKDIASITGTAIGAIGATVTVMKFLEARRDKQRRLTVRVSRGLPFNIRGVHDDLVMVDAANPGAQPVTLTSWGFLLKDGRSLVSLDANDGTVRLPHKLPPGENCRMWMVKPSLAAALLEKGYHGTVDLVGFYTDALGTTHKSAEAFKFDLPHSA